MTQSLAVHFDGNTTLVMPSTAARGFPGNTAQGNFIGLFNLDGVAPTEETGLVQLNDPSTNEVYFQISLVPQTGGGVALRLLIDPNVPQSGQNVPTLDCTFVDDVYPVDANWHMYILAWSCLGGSPGLVAVLDVVGATLPPLNGNPDNGPVYYRYGYWNEPGTFSLGAGFSGRVSDNCPASGKLPYLGGGSNYPDLTSYSQPSITYPESLWKGDGSFVYPASYGPLTATDVPNTGGVVGAAGTVKSYRAYAKADISITNPGSATLSFTAAGHTYQQTETSGANFDVDSGVVTYGSGFTVSAASYSGAIANSGITSVNVGNEATYAYPGFWTTNPFDVPFTSPTMRAQIGGGLGVANFVGDMAGLFGYFTPYDYIGIGSSILTKCFVYAADLTPILHGGSGYDALNNPNIAGGELNMTPQIFCEGDTNSFTLGLNQQGSNSAATMQVSGLTPVWTVVGDPLTNASSDPYTDSAIV